ncbi:MAG TPA: sulfate ABC transporter permease subunit [Longimicrobium sp.]|nr:sulfate ABC transporter permease subunit [Longimicrobium sp.]
MLELRTSEGDEAAEEEGSDRPAGIAATAEAPSPTPPPTSGEGRKRAPVIGAGAPTRVMVPAIVRPPRRRIRWNRIGGMAVTAAVLVYLGLVLVLPLAALVVEAVRAGAGEAVRALAAPEGMSALVNSLLLVGIALAVNGTLGIAGAIVLVRHRFPGRRLLDALVDLPLALSPVMAGLAVLLLFGRSGWLDPLLRPSGIRVAFAFPGMVICTLLVTLPFTIREVGHVLEELGTGDEEAAATLGATPWQTFWRVTLPNVRRGLTFGLTLTAARALGEFGAVLVVGGAISGRTQTATTFIYAAAEERNTAAAYGTAALLAAASMLLLLALQAVRRHTTEVRDGNPG